LARAIARIDPASGQPFSTGVVTDITDRKIVEQRITHLANHDSLTGLPSRKLFSEHLQSAIEGIETPHGSFAVMFIDLDRFKVINDTLGHAAGDQLLQTIASRFKAAVRRDDMVARLGGDEFVVLASDVQSPRQAELIARKLLDAAREPIVLAGQECHVGASIGICLAPVHGTEAELLLQRADVAMYQAKEMGRNKFQVFDEKSPEAEHRLRIELQLATALERGEFHLVYQPQVHPGGSRIRGVEALLRWDNPSLGSIPPVQFIPIAEEMGVIAAIGAWVMEEACRQAQAWTRQGLKPITMAVNVSAQQFRDPGFYEMVRETLQLTGLDPSQLEIEITESAVVRNPEEAIRTLAAIRALRVKVALDDFGTGHSSLSQLRILPLDVLKIDQSFVLDIHRDEGAKAIANAIAVMGKALGLEVVAEGLETAADADYLRTHTSCDVFQGYLFGRPMSANEMLLRLSNQLSE
jgi:diguanylate cyclase (GGDEF)-like protein